MSEKPKDQVRDFNDTLSAFDVVRKALVVEMTPEERNRVYVESPWRCDVTKNPVGTDTVMVGATPCQCQGCRAAREIESLDREVEHFGALAFDDLGKNPPEAWKDIAARLRAEVERLREALREIAEAQLYYDYIGADETGKISLHVPGSPYDRGKRDGAELLSARARKALEGGE